MVKNVLMKNSEIYTIANNLLEAFQEEVTLPVKVNFYLQKNKNAIVSIAQEIEQERMKIFEEYGTKTEDGTQYTFGEDVVEKANQELKDLFDLEQEVKVYFLNIDSFGDDTVLTSKQMEAISYMFEDEEE